MGSGFTVRLQGARLRVRVRCLDFDPALRQLHRHLRFATPLRAAAAAAAARLFGGDPYVALHLRRDGYEHYCAGSGLRHYGGMRYGVRVRREMCYPSVVDVAAAVRAAQARHGAWRVLLATNSRDAAELRRLRALVPYERWEPTSRMLARSPELVPAVELLLCSRATAFVGAAWSKGPLGSAPARLLRLLRARLVAPCSSALPGWPPATGIPAKASAARASRLQSRRFHRLWPSGRHVAVDFLGHGGRAT